MTTTLQEKIERAAQAAGQCSVSDLETVLIAIDGSQGFRDITNRIKPTTRDHWRFLFDAIRQLNNYGFITVVKEADWTDKIIAAQLTDAGREWLNDQADVCSVNTLISNEREFVEPYAMPGEPPTFKEIATVGLLAVMFIVAVSL